MWSISNRSYLCLRCASKIRSFNSTSMSRKRLNWSNLNVIPRNTRWITSTATFKDGNIKSSSTNNSKSADWEPTLVDQEDHSRQAIDHNENDRKELGSQESSIDVIDSHLSDEEIVIQARNEFKDILPEGYLTKDQLAVYHRLFGEPQMIQQDEENQPLEPEDEPELQKESNDGTWQTVETEENPWLHQINEEIIEEEAVEEEEELDEDDEFDGEAGTVHKAGTSWVEQPNYQRTHPLTLAGRWGTTPSTIQLPKKDFVIPVAELLSRTHPKHLTTAVEGIFGGAGLPNSPSTPAFSRLMPQLPIPLNSKQSKMQALEADAFMVAVMPQTYASVTSILVEVRKRMGGEWLRDLMNKPGGPLILDVGGGGASVLAWREILKAEWEADEKNTKSDPVPFGKSTVITGSENLRYRSSNILNDTSFLPRLPEMVPEDQTNLQNPRKQYDIIVASHSLWNLEKDWERKKTVETLWSLLNPKGGILIVLEKGIPRGFEAVAAARSLLLKSHIATPPPRPKEELDTAMIGAGEIEQSSIDPKDQTTKEPGMIIAPCTNHSTCPLYTTAGIGQGRKNWCYFSQRYIRPPFLQTVLGAKRRNHDDVEFSYVAIQRGIDLRREEPDPYATEPRLSKHDPLYQDVAATDTAFLGYQSKPSSEESIEKAMKTHGSALSIFEDAEDNETKATTHLNANDSAHAKSKDTKFWAQHQFNPLTLPRIMLPPIKRKGHILIDLCTPHGSYERWLVSRKMGKQAFRDARKSKWGDLWALGAWSRDIRPPKVGKVQKVDPKRKSKRSKKLTKEDREDVEEDEKGEQLAKQMLGLH